MPALLSLKACSVDCESEQLSRPIEIAPGQYLHAPHDVHHGFYNSPASGYNCDDMIHVNPNLSYGRNYLRAD
jgi:hypothetical protein